MGTRSERAVDGEAAVGEDQAPPSEAASRRGVFIGKHRLAAAIACLDQEIVSLQKELTELETIEPSSASCKEVIASTEGKPDPLLPVTTGPENSSWDRWFQRVRSNRNNRWWAHKTSDFS
ncbi:hypothetical protein LUZ61_002359 [Rhynchospora tenuis]|uniref:G protein gamma domain-containing protein n=1 Tax=Rhynchospora tenuis TaxID=198213 RepID=A0AAD5ZJ78_9POAL|nr:hypothetical protein LUZ61_002359 [Rhynchospora tenuis]